MPVFGRSPCATPHPSIQHPRAKAVLWTIGVPLQGPRCAHRFGPAGPGKDRSKGPKSAYFTAHGLLDKRKRWATRLSKRRAVSMPSAEDAEPAELAEDAAVVPRFRRLPFRWLPLAATAPGVYPPLRSLQLYTTAVVYFLRLPDLHSFDKPRWLRTGGVVLAALYSAAPSREPCGGTFLLPRSVQMIGTW